MTNTTMKRFIDILSLAACALSLAACADEGQEYIPNPPYPGDNVYFASSIQTNVNLEQGATEFTVPISRGADASAAITVALASKGTAVETGSCTVPGEVSFAAGESVASITVAVNPDILGLNNAEDLTILVADGNRTTPYGQPSVALRVSIPLPWIVFDSGVMYETPFWDEEEIKILYYQQISDNIRYCRVPECFGHNAIAAGEEYDVQDYCFYWNTETNALYIPKQYMGFTDPDYGETWFCDESEFYNWYWKDSEGFGQEPGTPGWFNALDSFRARYPEDYYPYYDGNGGFYLSDTYTAGEPGTDDFFDMYFTNYQYGCDSFICDNFIRLDFDCSVEYGGMYVDIESNAFAILNFAGGSDVKGLKYVIAPQGTSPLDILAEIVAGESENIIDIVLSKGVATKQIPLDPGGYIVVAVPYGTDEELHQENATYCEFGFSGTGAPEVEASVQVDFCKNFYSPEFCAEHNLKDYNSLAVYIVGNEIASCTLLVGRASYYEDLTYDEFIDYVLKNGTKLSEDEIADINNKGCLRYCGSLPPGTKDIAYCYITNVYGKSVLLTDSITTAELELFASGTFSYSTFGPYVLGEDLGDEHLNMYKDPDEEDVYFISNCWYNTQALFYFSWDGASGVHVAKNQRTGWNGDGIPILASEYSDIQPSAPIHSSYKDGEFSFAVLYTFGGNPLAYGYEYFTLDSADPAAKSSCAESTSGKRFEMYPGLNLTAGRKKGFDTYAGEAASNRRIAVPESKSEEWSTPSRKVSSFRPSKIEMSKELKARFR